MHAKTITISELMDQSDVRFGTSGARGLVSDMTDEVCYAYTLAFLQHLEQTGELGEMSTIGIGGDLRPSTDRIMSAVARAIADKKHQPLNLGKLPSPALAHYGLERRIPTVMVTGSHIPADRNGIKYTKKAGEILKPDEAAIKRQRVELPAGLFDEKGAFHGRLPATASSSEAAELYVRRYLDFFEAGSLAGRNLGVFQHSTVGRELMVRILEGLGARVTPLAWSATFIPVDTEAVRAEDVAAAQAWSRQYGFDAIVSSDGDSDRPLISDETGKWLRGDVAGILCAAWLEADAVVTPVSCNTAVEKSGLFKRVLRTRIGSPYVIAGMQQAGQEGFSRVVGYEANGGFLTATPIERAGKTLQPLPTRDALILHLAILMLSGQRRLPISRLVAELPQRVTHSDRLGAFPTDRSRAKLAELYSGQADRDREAIEAVFGAHFGRVASVDATDGVRITFDTEEVVHLRPSGNAPEFRCYTEADSEERAAKINRVCIDVMNGWR